MNDLERKVTEMTVQNARLKAEVQSWAQKATEPNREMEAAKSESKKLNRDIQKLTDQLHHSTERADEN